MAKRASGSRVATSAVIVAASVFALLLWGGAHLESQSSTFRSRVTVVPIDVRVFDRNGNAVTDLRQEDFVVLEDGVPQAVRLFERYSLAPRTADLESRLQSGGTPRDSAGAIDRRVFLLVLGRVWLPDERFDTERAITAFIRHRLLPQDYVAVSAWNRATDLTTNHEQVAEIVEGLARYQRSIDNSSDGVRKKLALYGHRDGAALRPALEDGLDEVFRSRPTMTSGFDSAAARDLLGQIESHVQSNESGAAGTDTGRDVAESARGLSATVTGHVMDIFAGIRYLRSIQGEKRLVFFAAGGLWLPAVEDDRSLAVIASDARVAIDVIQTGGMPVFDEFGRPGAGRVSLEPSMTSRHLAETTGGRVSFGDYAERALARTDVSTRNGYLLGYYSSNPALDGGRRTLVVTVKRPPSARLDYRRSYLARDDTLPYDHGRLLAQDRILTAAQSSDEVRGIAVRLTGAYSRQAVSAEASVDMGAVRVEPVETRRIGMLHVTFFCLDGQGRLVGELWQRLDLKLSEETYRRSLAEGLRHAAVVKVTGPPEHLRAVVYDERSDRTGTAVLRLR